MKDWIFAGFRSIAEASNVTDKSGQTPRIATKYISFKDSLTGKIWTTTDLTYKKIIRKKTLEQFKRVYIQLFSKKKISIMLIVIRESKYENISRFLTDFKKNSPAKINRR